MGDNGLQNTTLCLVVKDSRILLGRKKKKIGKGKYNGFGGKVKRGESAEKGAMRELHEETGGKLVGEYGIRATAYALVGQITYIFPHKPEWDQVMHIYLVSLWEGTPRETDEMTIEWFDIKDIPYDQMWENDRKWLREVLQGKKVRGRVSHTNEEKTIDAQLEFVQNL